MRKKIYGWNDIPEGYVQEVDFYRAGLLIRLLANIKFFEKYAYPIAAKKGAHNTLENRT